jgi:putative DNA primase/helicase
VNASPLEKVLAALSASGCRCKRSGDGYQAQCPAHEDRNPSLSISVAADGKVLLKCHVGCSFESIVSALGLELRDLFPSVDVDTTSRSSKKARVPSTATATAKTKIFPSAAATVAELERRLGPRSAWWTYLDPNRQPVAVVVRWDKPDGKTFRPIANIGGGWRIGDPDGPWPLYRLPELLHSTGPVYVVEGEKAGDALHALGFTVTTSAHGAKSAKGTDWSPLAGRDVVILPDNDEAGAGYAESIIDLLTNLKPSSSIKIVNLPGLPAGGDVADFIAARKGGGHE